MVTQSDLVPSKRFLQHLVAKRGQSGSVECCRRRGHGRSRLYLRRRRCTRRNSATNCGGGQKLNGDLNLARCYESARPPMTASPHRECSQLLLKNSTPNPRFCFAKNARLPRMPAQRSSRRRSILMPKKRRPKRQFANQKLKLHSPQSDSVPS
jgi:hypothetical protein